MLAFVLGALVLTCIVGLLVAQATDDSWTEAVMHTPRNSHTLTLLSDGRVLAAGGWDGASPLASAEIYDPASSAWKTVSPMGSGSDYAATPDGTADAGGPEGPWVNLNVTAMMQAWVANPTSNKGMVVLQNAASGYVTYKFCSELGWSPCNAAQAPQLTIWYH